MRASHGHMGYRADTNTLYLWGQICSIRVGRESGRSLKRLNTGRSRAGVKSSRERRRLSEQEMLPSASTTGDLKVGGIAVAGCMKTAGIRQYVADGREKRTPMTD
jgi:hypothetical protein